MMIPDVPGARRVVDRGEVDAAYRRLVTALQPRIDEGGCVLLGVLLGGLLPLARLASALSGDFVLDTCRVGRYGAATQGGEPRWLAPPQGPLAGRHVILVDDIYDEGVTLDFIAARCRQDGARQVTSAVLVRKRHSRAITGPGPAYAGLEVGDEFVFGCGMDYQGRWRHLPDIWAVAG